MNGGDVDKDKKKNCLLSVFGVSKRDHVIKNDSSFVPQRHSE
jgi:hypothetical protein